jgi:hypothetical protein
LTGSRDRIDLEFRALASRKLELDFPALAKRKLDTRVPLTLRRPALRMARSWFVAASPHT